MEKGEIWLTNLPQIIGKEQIGKRPALVIADTKTSLVIIIPLTSNMETLKYPNTIKIKPSKINALNKESAALIFQMRAVDKGRIVHKIGNLEQEYMDHINKNLKELLKI